MISFASGEQKRRKLVEKLESENIIRSERVRTAFLEVEREEFVPATMKGKAYVDSPLPIGKGQTISAPHMVAIMAEELHVSQGMKVLEIGGGSGYHAAIVSRLVGENGMVISIERVGELAESARRSFRSAGIENVEMMIGDGSEGYEKEAPYDRIYYTCAAPFLPREVKDQLKVGGMILSVEGSPLSSQRLIRYTKDEDGNLTSENLTYCIFVPLIGKHGHSH